MEANKLKTLLLENDNFLWEGLGDFCKSFDPDYTVINVDTKHGSYQPSDDFGFVALLSQPFVERCIVASAFETVYKSKSADDHVYQLEHYIDLILQVVRFRERMKYKPLIFEINYHGDDFIKDLNRFKWGKNCTIMFDLIIRQNVDNLTVNIYKKYKFTKKLQEKHFKL